MRREGTHKRRVFRTLQLLAFAVAIVFGGLIFSSKVDAQGKAGVPAVAGAGGDGRPKLAQDAAALRYRDAGAEKGGKDAGATHAGRATVDAGVGDASTTGDYNPDAGAIGYAEVQTDDDFPKDMSAEERSAIGAGKVPIHREGPFRSPFAHPRFGGPANVKVGLVISQVREYNLQTGAFAAEFFLSLTADKAMGAITLAFPNGYEMQETVLADEPTFKFYRYSGKFVSAIDLRDYPFDTQKLEILIEDKFAGVDQLLFEADKARTALDAEFKLSSYGVGFVSAKAYKHLYPTRFDRDDLYISRYKYTVGIDRFATSAAFSVYVPSFIIVLISLIGLWVPPDELEVRSNAGAPMLAAAVLFHYSLIQALPATGYLTRADKLMLGVYLSLLVNMLSTWILLVVEEQQLDRTFRIARAWVPPATVVIMVVSCLV